MARKNQSAKAQTTLSDILDYLKLLHKKMEQLEQTLGGKIDAMHRDLTDNTSFTALGSRLEMICLELEMIREKLKVKSNPSEINDSVTHQAGRKPLH